MSNTNTTEATTQKESKGSSIRNWIIIVIGALFCAAGLFSWFGEDDTMNNAIIEAGTTQSCVAFIEEYPESKEHMQKVAESIEAAIEARETSPEKLAAIINEKLSDLVGKGIKVDAIVEAIVLKINTAHKVSDTENQYIEKVKYIVKGIKASTK